MTQVVGLRTFNRSIKIRVQDYLSGQNVQLSTQYDVLCDLDNETNKIALGHHSAIGQFIVTSTNNTATAISGTVLISGSLTTLPPNTVGYPLPVA
jgi:hypothetical protein